MSIQLYKEPTPRATYKEVVQDVNLFAQTLQDLHRSLGTRYMIPTMGGKDLDLHRLFVEVTARGGIQKLIGNRQWGEVISVFNFPRTITNASFVLRKYYSTLLLEYEKVYFFRQEPSSSTVHIQAAIQPTEGSTNAVALPANSQWNDRWVTGTIDAKFDNGYLVTVNFGPEKLNGVLYHVPSDSQKLQNSNSSTVSRRRKRKKSWLSTRDPNLPKLYRSGYNFFYSEQYARLKPLHQGQEKYLSTMISNLWANLAEGEKQVYQERGHRDKVRYESEMLEYRKSSGTSKLE